MTAQMSIRCIFLILFEECRCNITYALSFGNFRANFEEKPEMKVAREKVHVINTIIEFQNQMIYYYHLEEGHPALEENPLCS